MLSDRIIINRDFGRKVVAFIGNPIIAFILTTISAIFFLIISLSQKTPYYYVTTPNLAASRITDSLELTFGNRPIRNLYFVDLVLWNNGNQFIDHSDFIESKPTVLKSIGQDHFLASEIICKSRSDLQFTVQTFPDAIFIKMKGDEALEQGDGVAFRVYYTSNTRKQTKFMLSSRIKGTKKGFIYNDIQRTNKAVHTRIVLIGWCIILALILIRSVVLIVFRKPVVFRFLEVSLLFLAILIWSYYTYEYIYIAVDIPWFKLSKFAS